MYKTVAYNKGVEDKTNVTGAVLLQREYRVQKHTDFFVTGLMTVKNTVKLFVITFKNAKIKKK